MSLLSTTVFTDGGSSWFGAVEHVLCFSVVSSCIQLIYSLTLIEGTYRTCRENRKQRGIIPGLHIGLSFTAAVIRTFGVGYSLTSSCPMPCRIFGSIHYLKASSIIPSHSNPKCFWTLLNAPGEQKF